MQDNSRQAHHLDHLGSTRLAQPVNGSDHRTALTLDGGVAALALDIADLKAQIRQKVERQRTTAPLRNGTAGPPDNGSSGRQLRRARPVATSLDLAKRNANVGLTLPELASSRGPRRWLALLVARGVLVVSRFLTHRQREFNQAALSALKGLNRSAQDLDQGIADLGESVHVLEQALAKLGDCYRLLEIENARLRTQQQLQERRLAVLLEEARRRLPEPFDAAQARVLREEEDHLEDALYALVEDPLRGGREDLKESFRVYLPFLRAAGAGTEARPVLDLGCGRGEWLELLRSESFRARGVDRNRALVEQTRRLGLDALEGDALTHLRGLPAGSLGAVTGFFLLEHLVPAAVARLLGETVRVLAPGGLAVFETPDPENLVAGSCTFYADPTRRRPWPRALVHFLAEACGLCRVETLHPYPAPPGAPAPDPDSAGRFNHHFDGPRSYAVVGRKA